jgi:hypothetical protein
MKFFAAAVTLLALCVFAQEQKPFEKPWFVSIKRLPSKPIVVPGCKVDSSSGYLNMPERKDQEGYGDRNLTDEELGRFIKKELKAGIISTIYPDEGGIFVVSECQEK